MSMLRPYIFTLHPSPFTLSYYLRLPMPSVRFDIVQRLRFVLDDPARRLQLALLTLVLIILVGSLGYMWIEGMDTIDAVYMTVITIATVGYGEVNPLSHAGRIFTIGLILTGMATTAWAVGSGVELLVGRTLWLSLQRRKMDQLLKTIDNHYIICGYGRMGRQVARDLRARDEAFVVVDVIDEKEERAYEDQVPFVNGNATRDEVLLRAGIERAKGIVTAIGDDAENVLAVLTARGLNANLLIVARGTDEAIASKLRRAGADRVVSPYAIGSHRMALALMQPTAHDFMGRIFDLEDLAIDIGELRINPGSPLAGKTIAETLLKKKWDLIVLAIRVSDQEEFIISPRSDLRIAEGDILIVFGSPSKIGAVERREAGITGFNSKRNKQE